MVRGNIISYKAVILDLGGVYFENGLHFLKRLSKEEGFKENRFLEIIKKKYFPMIETSKISEKDFWVEYKKDVGYKASTAYVKKVFLSNGPMLGMKEIVRKTRRKVKVGLLTNNMSEWYKKADKNYEISKEFDAVIVSADVKTRKPGKKIYKIMAERLGVKPSECVFFDDYFENIIGAQKVGMVTFQFRSAKDVEKKLVELGILDKSKKKIFKKSKAMRQSGKNIINFRVNNQNTKTAEGTTVLKALGEAGIKVPTLCYAPIFSPRANCRICLVEIKGLRNLQTACSTEIKEDMEIFTDTKKVKKARQTNLKLLYQDHLGKCPTCERFNNCELLKLVSKYKAGSLAFKGKERKIPIDESGTVIFDMNKCIKCGRCIDACKKFGSDVLEMKKRGFDMVAGTKNGKKLKDSGCIGCKQCASVCPVGAIYEK